MALTVLHSVPQLLRGRGYRATFALKCSCGSHFLWGRISDPRDIKCPNCGTIETLTEDAPILNGSSS